MGYAARLDRMSLDEFLIWESAQQQRHEFIDGEVFAMAGAEDRHVTITLNVAMALRQHLAGSPCRTYMSDMNLQVAQRMFYPDVLVTCSDADRQDRLIKREPTLIVEVLSTSTAADDRGEKFASYRQIATLQELALIDPATRRSDVYRRAADGLWVLHPFEPEHGIAFGSLGLVLDSAQLFAEVEGA
jgi:Uma2 family endonuclease